MLGQRKTTSGWLKAHKGDVCSGNLQGRKKKAGETSSRNSPNMDWKKWRKQIFLFFCLKKRLYK